MDRDDYKKLFDDYNFDAKKSDLDVDVDMEIGNWNVETLSGKTLWMPKEPVKYVKTTIPADADISNTIDELLGKPTLIEELTKLVIKDEQEMYIRELLIKLKELKDKVEQLKAELEAIKELGDLTEDDIPWLRGEGEDGEN